MKISNKKIIMSLSVLSTPFVVDNLITENIANANTKYNLTESAKVYGTAQNAEKQTNSTRTYDKGTYYLYKEHNGMINISRTEGKAGAWINPKLNNKVEANSTRNQQATVSTSSKETKVVSKASTQQAPVSTSSKETKVVSKASTQQAPVSTNPKETKVVSKTSTQQVAVQTSSQETKNSSTARENTYTLNNNVKTYQNSEAAKKQRGAIATYKTGNYFIFKEFNGMMNISKVAGRAGAWINPGENKAILAKDGGLVNSNQKIEEKKALNQLETISNTVNNSELKAGSIYRLNKKLNVYSNAIDAKNLKNSRNTYDQGNYYIYKIHNGMINISRTRGSAGAWINPGNDLGTNTRINKVTETKTTNKQNIGDLSKYSDKRFSWSWNYPSKEGLKVLESNGGLYKYYTNKKELYLTFDNGYEAGYTSKILDSLKNNGVKAVFFVTGTYIQANRDLVKRMEAEGHIVANHTLNHYSAANTSANVIAKDIKDWENVYIKYMGKKPTTNLYRPATGAFSERTVKGAASHGYKLVQWSYAYKDWIETAQPQVKSSRDKLINNSKPGDIILLHSISKTNKDLLDGYIKEMKSRGYTFKQVR
ncbi:MULTISPECIES: polysaccharide deacetylase family protein [unclassified Gemella]|uniref:polysaccharide deacetylase family protein n=1 Tax=unclassified Gemella TaxID=2624949 RepID=UPI0015D0575E|nr:MULTISPECIES: polysaccharide deacetylase family protein [unclassified Gemella]MBF0709899.1 polysaccharide deacetylase family protein [Gemella sp. GL1.1]NYS27243.1 polysaccharide deacetylase family protein [Gemella sp. GL1]